MALAIYLLASNDSVLSQNGDLINPLAVTFDGRSGGYKQFRLYVRNNSALYYYDNITMTVQDTSGNNIVDRSVDSFTWKLSEGDNQPTQADWDNTAAANTINFTDIGAPSSPDTSTFLPFWVRIEIPAGLDVQTFDDVQFVLHGQENLI